MISYTIPNRDKSTDKTIAVTESEATWIKKNMQPIELELVGWLNNQNPSDLMAIITGDLREMSGTTQATRIRLHQQHLIIGRHEPLTLEASLRQWHLTTLLQEHVDQTRAIVLGADNFIEIKLDRTATNWNIAPLYFNSFIKKLLNLAPQKEVKPKSKPLTPSPLWSFTPAV